MSRVFTILILLISFYKAGSAQWFSQASGTENNLRCISFVNANTGYICGDDVLLKTTNAGINWIKTDFAGFWNSIYFINSSTGFLCGENGKILKTTNEGANWIQLNSGVNTNLTSIRFTNENTGYVTGWFKTLLVTTNGGNTFSNPFGSAYYMWRQTFVLNNYIFLVGSEGALFRSSNSGASWDSLYIGMPNSLSSVHFFENGNGFVFGCCGAFFRAHQFGDHWMHDTVYLTQGWALEDCFFSGNTGWSVGELGSIVRTTDAGISWESLPSNTQSALKSVKFVNNMTGWAAGFDGVILKTTNGGGQGVPIGIENNTAKIADNFILHQNFPNPFNPSTNIKFSLNKSSDVKLSVFDASGKLKQILAENFYKQGEYSIQWRADEQPSGIYFCKIETSSGSQTIKMLLIK
jgi:photosystem II stability/assembly factor-like uncharacterized protein